MGLGMRLVLLRPRRNRCAPVSEARGLKPATTSYIRVRRANVKRPFLDGCAFRACIRSRSCRL